MGAPIAISPDELRRRESGPATISPGELRQQERPSVISPDDLRQQEAIATPPDTPAAGRARSFIEEQYGPETVAGIQQFREEQAQGPQQRMTRGVGQMVEGPDLPSRARGFTEAATGAGMALAPALPWILPAAVAAAPAATMAGKLGVVGAELGGGLATEYLAREGLESAGVSPEVSEAVGIAAGSVLPIRSAVRGAQALRRPPTPPPTAAPPTPRTMPERMAVPPSRQIPGPGPRVATGAPVPPTTERVVPRTTPPTLVPPSRQLPPPPSRIGPEMTGRPEPLWAPTRTQDIGPETVVQRRPLRKRGPKQEPGPQYGDLTERAKLMRQLEAIGYEIRPEARQTKAATIELGREEAAAMHPTLQRVQQQNLRRDAQIAKLNNELQDIQAAKGKPTTAGEEIRAAQQVPPPGPVTRAALLPDAPREAKIKAELEKLSAQRSSPQEQRLIDEALADVEQHLTGKELAQARAAQKPKKLGKGAKRQVVEPQDPYASPRYSPRISKRGGTFRKPPARGTPRNADELTPAPPGTLSEAFDNKMLKMESDWIDRLAPIQAMEQLRGGVPFSESGYAAARLFAGAMGRFENRIDNLRSILPQRTLRQMFKNEDPLDTLLRYSNNERLEEVSTHGVNLLPEGKTLEQVRAENRAIEQGLSPDELGRLRASQQALVNYSNALLEDSVDAGLISRQTADNFLARGEKFVPLQRIADFIEAQQAGVGGRSLSSGKQDLYHALGPGSELPTRDTIEQIIENTLKQTIAAGRNRAAQKIADLRHKPEFKDLVMEIPEGQRPPRGYDKFSAMYDGQRHDFAVPEQVATAIKGMDEVQSDIVTQFMARSARIFRNTVTTWNPGFWITNAPRDFLMASVKSEVGFSPMDFFKGAMSRILQDEHYKGFREAGGEMAGIFSQMRRIPSTTQEVTESLPRQMMRPGRMVRSPTDLLQYVNEIIESGTRVGVYRRGLQQRGQRAALSEPEAAFTSRNSTVDFARFGNLMRVANQWTPFLNARLQGATNILDVGNNTAQAMLPGATPEQRRRAKQSQLAAATYIIAPAVATYFMNTRMFPETYANIRDFEKKNNFLLIYGDEVDDEGNPTQVLKIPKGEPGRMIGNPVEASLEFMDGVEPEGMGKMAARILLGDLSPLDLEQIVEGEAPTRAVGQLMPPLPRGIVEGITNYEFFSDMPIEPRGMEGIRPERRFEEDPKSFYYAAPAFRTISKATGIPPLRLQHVFESQFGALGRAASNPMRAGELLKRRVVGARGGQQQAEQHERLTEQSMDVGTEQFERRRTIKDFAREVHEAEPHQKSELFMQGIQPLIHESEDIDSDLDRLENEFERNSGKLNRYEQRLKAIPSNEIKARHIVGELDLLEGDMEAVGSTMSDWFEKGIITAGVMDEMEKVWAEREPLPPAPSPSAAPPPGQTTQQRLPAPLQP